MANCGEDPSAEWNIDEIIGLFPHLLRDDVRIALARYNNDFEKSVDYLLTNAGSLDALYNEDQKRAALDYPFYEGEAHNTSVDNTIGSNVLDIMAMLPNVDRALIESALIEHSGDVERTVSYLFDSQDTSSSSRPSFNIHSTDFKLNKISELTEVTNDTASLYLNKNKQDIVDSLVDIINNYKGGEFPELHSKDRLQYLWKDVSQEVKDLGDIVASDKVLSELSWVFCTNCLKFFKGNVPKALTLLLYIAEKRGIKATYGGTSLDFSNITSANPRVFKPIKAELSVVKKNTRKSQPSLSSSSSSASESDQFDDHQLKLREQQLVCAKRDSKLDLHNFNVSNAKITCNIALGEWWRDELKAREDCGRSEPGKIARHLEPLIIITGRGIHSDGGVSKVRISILALLKKSPYIFVEDHMGMFRIKGKKVTT